MRKYRLLFSFGFILTCFSCNNVANYIPSAAVSDADIVQGLKDALSVGTDSTVKLVSRADGYFADAFIKILLPNEAQSAISSLRSTGFGESAYQATIKSLEDNLILSINRAAENASVKSVPIIKNAIIGMSINDGKNILFGTDSAATNYLRVNTYTPLLGAYAPQIDSSLNKPLLLGLSANNYWSSFVTGYNIVATGGFLGLTPINNTSLGTYVTNKALAGLFVKIKDQEKSIRKDPLKRVTTLLQKVFGQLDTK